MAKYSRQLRTPSASSPSMARVFARIEELGLITRQRRVRLSLTQRGRTLGARMAPRIDAAYQHIEGLIGSESRAFLSRNGSQLAGRSGRLE